MHLAKLLINIDPDCHSLQVYRCTDGLSDCSTSSGRGGASVCYGRTAGTWPQALEEEKAARRAGGECEADEG